eukprot:CAMPEP_0206491072 /NCGR_PEP_ID=MMETSP0324_2-20121206/44644_1 /ASSEMBLY_ACC=CAM_ASM_000836 /TAXON_ID=2866 /ORGANISM="Crypthecodinium cohnii, Strain Seligo" /LENGTH=105 /DNA_ID=CAMNT_0053971925 /DNA_START=422 /DNA_END=740 /DNA_ORIENTATION=+
MMLGVQTVVEKLLAVEGDIPLFTGLAIPLWAARATITFMKTKDINKKATASGMANFAGQIASSAFQNAVQHGQQRWRFRSNDDCDPELDSLLLDLSRFAIATATL